MDNYLVDALKHKKIVRGRLLTVTLLLSNLERIWASRSPCNDPECEKCQVGSMDGRQVFLRIPEKSGLLEEENLSNIDLPEVHRKSHTETLLNPLKDNPLEFIDSSSIDKDSCSGCSCELHKSSSNCLSLMQMSSDESSGKRSTSPDKAYRRFSKSEANLARPIDIKPIRIPFEPFHLPNTNEPEEEQVWLLNGYRAAS